MKILLDENLPHELRHYLAQHDARTVTYMGWSGIRNSELLARAAEAGFDVLLTMDKRMGQEQASKAPIAVVVLRARSNTMARLQPMTAAVLMALEELQAGSIVIVEA